MMRTACMFLVATVFLACSGPDPYDKVRMLRRQYKIENQFTASNESKTLSYEIKIQNLTSEPLQDLTVDAKAFDANEKVIWEKRHELDVTGLGHYASKTFSFKQELSDIENLDAFSVYLAPDTKDSNFKTYPEFMRVAK